MTFSLTTYDIGRQYWEASNIGLPEFWWKRNSKTETCQEADDHLKVSPPCEFLCAGRQAGLSEVTLRQLSSPSCRRSAGEDWGHLVAAAVGPAELNSELWLTWHQTVKACERRPPSHTGAEGDALRPHGWTLLNWCSYWFVMTSGDRLSINQYTPLWTMDWIRSRPVVQKICT